MKKFASLLTLAALFASLAASPAGAETLYGVTVFRSLIKFDSTTPGTIDSTVGITGLTGQNDFESIAAIDFRPATGQLYALGNAPGSIYRIYTLDTTTAVATQVGADINLTGVTFLGFDFNPVADLLRVVTDGDHNLRYNPTTGALVATDTTLAYVGGDAHSGANPNVVGAAYTNNFPGAASTVLYDIDSTLDLLATQNPANAGGLATVGALGVNFSDTVGFDISGITGMAFATEVTGGGITNLYTINLATGAATIIDDIGVELPINDIAALPGAVPEPGCAGLAAMGAVAAAMRLPRRCIISRR